MDMTQLWKYLDTEVAITPMPPEYDNYMVDILCKDCHKVSKMVDTLHCVENAGFLFGQTKI